jgi:uncharacterized protein YwgA
MADAAERRGKLAAILESNGWPVRGLRAAGDRLLAQKRIYLLQAFGLELGYRFRGWRKGPYSTQLTSDFAALLAKPVLPADGVRWATDAQSDKYERFRSFVSGRSDDAAWLEAATAIHFMWGLYTDVTRGDILSKLERKYPHLPSELCARAWDDLARARLV